MKLCDVTGGKSHLGNPSYVTTQIGGQRVETSSVTETDTYDDHIYFGMPGVGAVIHWCQFKLENNKSILQIVPIT